MAIITVSSIAQQVRQLLSEALADFIGVYTLPSGQTVPAICVESQNKYPHRGVQIEGLEVSVVPAISITSAPFLSTIDRWAYRTDIILRQYDRNKTTVEAMFAAYRALKPIGIVEVKPRVLPLDELANVESVRIQITQEFYLYEVA